MSTKALGKQLPPDSFIEWDGTVDKPDITAFGIHGGEIAVDTQARFHLLPSGLAIPAAVNAVEKEPASEELTEPSRLTSLQVIALAMGYLGMTVSNTGEGFYRGKDTIQWHRNRAYTKLGVGGRSALIMSIGQVLRAGILTIQKPAAGIVWPELAICLAPQLAQGVARGKMTGLDGQKLTLNAAKVGLKGVCTATGLSPITLVLYGYLSGKLQWEEPEVKEDVGDNAT